jgi:hypothetical protein
MDSEAAPAADARAQDRPQGYGRDHRARVVQNIRHGHYELGVEEPTTLRVVAAFTELAVAI